MLFHSRNEKKERKKEKDKEREKEKERERKGGREGRKDTNSSLLFFNKDKIFSIKVEE